MDKYIEEFIYYGDDIRIERFPAETRFIYGNPPMEPLAGYERAIAEALDTPLSAKPLEEQLTAQSRVTIAFDDPCLPIPLMRRDPRGLVIEELLRRLFRIGIAKDRITLICANGLHRKWTLKELTLVLGRKVVGEMGPGRIVCHDATRDDRLISLGRTEAGHEVEINRAVEESDITIYVNVNFTSMNGGWKSVLVGLGSWRSIRHHHTPGEWNPGTSVMDPERSPMHGILADMGQKLRERYNLFQVECVLNNRVWPVPLGRVLGPLYGNGRNNRPVVGTRSLLGSASYAPQGLKRTIRNSLVRAGYQLCAVNAGEVAEVHRKTLEILFLQQNVAVAEPVDIVILGVPNLSPYSAQSIFNPILLRSLVLGYFLGLFRKRPLVKKGGVVVAYNPGIEKFHAGHHPAYIDFWKNDCVQFADPHECWDQLSEPYAANSAYLKQYRDGFAYHGTHGLINWMWSGMGLKHLKGAILAGAREPETAKKIGFIPVADFGDALSLAREMAGRDATMAYQVIPPLFCCDVGT